MREEIIYTAAQLLIMIISTLVARYLIPMLKQQTENEKVKQLAMWAEWAVRWAEQIYHDETGAQRKEHVVQLIMDIARKSNIPLSMFTEQQIDALIEAAVKTMNIEMKEIAVTKEEPTNSL